MHGHFERNNAKKPGGVKKVLLIVLGIVLLLAVAIIIGVVVYYNSMLDKINYVEVPKITYTQSTTPEGQDAQAEEGDATETPETTAPHVASSEDYINFLVVGQSSRAGEEARMADTMILCTLNTYEKTLTMTSMLRDAFVKMPDYKGHYGGRIKLTTIYNLGSYYSDGDPAGSMELMNQTLYDNFGIEVDYNFEVDFDAFVWIVDAIGGVDIELTEAEANYLNDDDVWVTYDVEPGMAHLDGMAALSYARMRKAEGDSESDIVRTSRQRKLMEIILSELKKEPISGLQNLANEVLPKITTSMSKSDMTSMLLTILPMLPDLKVNVGGTCPADYWGDYVDIYSDDTQHSVLRFDVAQTTKTMRAITEGEGLETMPTEAEETTQETTK